MRTWRKIVTELTVLTGAKRHRFDLLRYLARRPALLAATGGYETAILFSSRVEDRLKCLAQIQASTLVGCPF